MNPSTHQIGWSTDSIINGSKIFLHTHVLAWAAGFMILASQDGWVLAGMGDGIMPKWCEQRLMYKWTY